MHKYLARIIVINSSVSDMHMLVSDYYFIYAVAYTVDVGRVRKSGQTIPEAYKYPIFVNKINISYLYLYKYRVKGYKGLLGGRALKIIVGYIHPISFDLSPCSTPIFFTSIFFVFSYCTHYSPCH